MGNYVKKKKEMVFQSVDALQQVVNVVNEAAQAVNDKSRTIRQSAIPEVLTGALGAGIGGVGSFFALYGLGTVGLSAAGITSGLATAGAVVGGGMVAGVFVLAAPVALLAAGGVGVAAHLKSKQLRQEKERLYPVGHAGVPGLHHGHDHQNARRRPEPHALPARRQQPLYRQGRGCLTVRP